MAVMVMLEPSRCEAPISRTFETGSQYLREVRAGGEIVVRDRQRPIAKIIPFTVDGDDADDAALIADGLMRRGSGALPPSFWTARRPRVAWQKAAAAVRTDRDDA